MTQARLCGILHIWPPLKLKLYVHLLLQKNKIEILCFFGILLCHLGSLFGIAFQNNLFRPLFCFILNLLDTNVEHDVRFGRVEVF